MFSFWSKKKFKNHPGIGTKVKIKVGTKWKFSSELLHFCTSESSKNQSLFALNEGNGQGFIITEVQKLAREFSHGLDLR